MLEMMVTGNRWSWDLTQCSNLNQPNSKDLWFCSQVTWSPESAE